jgi:transposase
VKGIAHGKGRSSSTPKSSEHPWGFHRPRTSGRLVFDKLVQVLVFGCAYERISDEPCSATTLRRRRDEWIDLGVMEKLQEIVLGAYDRIISLELSDVAVDCCIRDSLWTFDARGLRIAS